MDLSPMEIGLIILVLLLLFGAKRLPDTARSLGRSLRILKAETKGLRDDDNPPEIAPAAQVYQQQPYPAPPQQVAPYPPQQPYPPQAAPQPYNQPSYPAQPPYPAQGYPQPTAPTQPVIPPSGSGGQA